ncbi:DHS-like NAD/FAD-binding domain-containing protein [Collybia nuda]|uniref:DHS-like NAD/FAD-binding domain-containing protein n=1 Tax=Collybia nuda TaxID=64659 RepID=A0A9P5Y2N3_9AGAR|nr:DHS-like NAD/FAD-binding domain-containing protein [Collybia nuda]
MTVTLNLSDLKNPSTRRSLSDLSLAVAKSKKIVVVTGAGISCSCGIPDFRSSDGLYALVKEQYPDVVLKGRDLFDASLFRDAKLTAVFYTFIAQLKKSIDSALPAPTHHFIKILDTKKKLLRSYTQNIDGLEARVGLLGTSSQEAKHLGQGKTKIRTSDVRNVQLHGDIHRVRCMSCSAEYPYTIENLEIFKEGTPPDCPECLTRSEARAARSARPIRVGSLRPAVVLYDEPHPLGDFIGSIQSADLARKPDLLIIMGTSLKVHGFKKLVKEFAKTIHTPAGSSSSAKPRVGRVIFVNKTPPPAEWLDIIDYHVEGETDTWVNKVVEDWKKMRPSDWEVQQTLVATDGDVTLGNKFKTIKNIPAPRMKGKRKSEQLWELHYIHI